MSNYLDRYNIFLKLLIKIFKINNEDRYGRSTIVEYASEYLREKEGGVILDIASGKGTDLINIRNANNSKQIKLFGLEAYKPNVDFLESVGISTFQVDLEKDKLPFEDQSVDIVVANQILEHCKELWWIMSEVSRVLKKDGIIIIGVPNLASIHCRVALLFGRQPTCMEVHSSHIRGFVFNSLKYFIEDGNYFSVEGRTGRGFYSIIPCTSKFMAKLFPNQAVCTILYARRTDKKGLFIENLKKVRYETNYWDGGNSTDFKIVG